MTKELELDKDVFEEFVRETLLLPKGTDVTDEHYEIVQERLAKHEIDLEWWLAKRKMSALAAGSRKLEWSPAVSNTPKSSGPGESKPTPPPAINRPASLPPVSKPAVPPTKPETPPAAASAPAKQAPAAKRPTGTGTSRAGRRALAQAQPKKGPLKLLWSIVSFLVLIGMVVYIVGWYLPLDTRENIAKSEQLKSVPPDFVQALLFRGSHRDHEVTLEAGKPVTLRFSVTKPFRLIGDLKMGSPVRDRTVVRASVTEEKLSKNVLDKDITFETKKMELEDPAFDDRLPAGEYRIDLELATVGEMDKVPADFSMAIRY